MVKKNNNIKTTSFWLSWYWKCAGFKGYSMAKWKFCNDFGAPKEPMAGRLQNNIFAVQFGETRDTEITHFSSKFWNNLK